MAIRGQLILCENLIQTQQGTESISNLVNPLLQLNVPFLPVTQTISFLIILNADSNSDFVDSTKYKVVFSINDIPVFEMPEQLIPRNLPNNVDTLNLGGTFKNIIFKDDGLHKVSLIVGDDEIFSSYLSIKNQKVLI